MSLPDFCTAIWISVFGLFLKEAGYRSGEKFRVRIVGPDTPIASPISGDFAPIYRRFDRLFGATDQLMERKPDSAEQRTGHKNRGRIATGKEKTTEQATGKRTKKLRT